MGQNNRRNFISINPENVEEHGLFCIKNKKADGYRAKLKWFLDQYDLGLRLFIAVDQTGKQLGFVECIPAEFAWRPVLAENYLFIQCITIYSKSDRRQGLGSELLNKCERLAVEGEMAGLCTMTSTGPWVADNGVFEQNGYQSAEKQDRFELWLKPLQENGPPPSLADWRKEQSRYQGWHLVYADQCPWHQKAVTELCATAAQNGIDLQVTQLVSPEQIRRAPSGFGTFSLLRDGRLLADHYISKTRFRNILKKEY